ncbi:hypothetical protein [Streptomyces sp. 8L]|uniref:hypothetical protein n=1 Tax=Streptomyces sp. 8L TaxID=2877242 RepID=UPI001CD7E137|nr:hypothetical protein [Streptomyces sp. 8L]MCA1220212.1 hypothetical protein [Streptomyces sp. 8L]
MVTAGRHFGCPVFSCVPYGPELKDDAEATIRIAKADLVPHGGEPAVRLRLPRRSRGRLPELALTANTCRHRLTGQIPADRLDTQRATLYVLQVEPALALVEEMMVGSDRTISFKPVRCSTRLPRHQCLVPFVSDELSITAHQVRCPLEIWRHQLSTPGVPQTIVTRYPDHLAGRAVHQPRLQPRSEADVAFVSVCPESDAG